MWRYIKAAFGLGIGGGSKRTAAIFVFDSHTGREIDTLMPVFDAKDRADMIRKALIFARICTRHMDRDGFLKMRGPDGTVTEIDMIL